LAKLATLDAKDYDPREERAFKNWINSFGIEGVSVRNLFEDLKYGLITLKLLDRVEPGSVPWKRAEKNPKNKYRCLANCSLSVEVGKKIGLVLVNIGPNDLYNKNRKLTLAYLWQLIRYHTLKQLGNLTEKKLVEWANNQV